MVRTIPCFLECVWIVPAFRQFSTVPHLCQYQDENSGSELEQSPVHAVPPVGRYGEWKYLTIQSLPFPREALPSTLYFLLT